MAQNRTVRLIAGALATLLGGLYIANPTFGFFEFIPDALPLVGNLDEAGATALLIWGLAQFRPAAAAAPHVIEQPAETPRLTDEQERG
ncbi:MAG: DUF1232 domain-containing protein [Chloroflexaceae bacterium]|nr:DUF1232 domain-containing protein [Chloroflexaceae bacterium]NJO05794.1 DUF1232 domain-containing protein [Chloroflexaceae bacterium]